MDEHVCGNCKWFEKSYCDRTLNIPEWMEHLMYESFGHWGIDEFRFRTMAAGEGSECDCWESLDE